MMKFTMKGGDATVKAIYYLIIILCLSIIGYVAGTVDSHANPCMQIVMGGTTGTAAPPAACETQTTPNTMETSDGTYELAGSANGNKYVASRVIADATTGTVCRICPSLNKVQSPTMDFSVKLYSNTCTTCDRSDDEPNAVLDDYGSMNAANIAGTFGDCFSLGSVALAEGTVFHVVIINNSAANPTNYFRWVRDNTCTSEQFSISSDGSTWSVNGSGKCGTVKLYTVAP